MRAVANISAAAAAGDGGANSGNAFPKAKGTMDSPRAG